MAIKSEQVAKTAEQKASDAEKYKDTLAINLSGNFCVLSPDQVSDGKTFFGTVGIKSVKGEWVRFSYIDFKKLMDFCKVNAPVFNRQLQQEKGRMLVEEL